ncbi:MAG: hypothetical protein U9Q78_07250 [Chloroflexota bacterium]|nr:hypothetical protein [Chloroflexota bacterium]
MSRPQSSFRAHLLALLLFILLTVAMTYPLAFQAWDKIENYGDPLLNTWILAWDTHQLLRNPLHLFHANNFHPYPNTLAYSENLLAIAIPSVPFLLLTGNPIWVHNLSLLLSFALCGWTAYLLVYDHTRNWAGGVVAGIIYGFAHYRWGHISHLQLLSAQWLPLVLLYLRHFVQRGHRPRDAALAAVFFVLQALSCTYYAFYTTLTVLLYLTIAAKREAWSVKRICGYTKSSTLYALRDTTLHATLAAGAVLLILVPVAWPYLQARAQVGGFELEAQSGARLVAWITAAEGTLLGDLTPFDAFGRRSEHTFFPGVVALALALWGLLHTQHVTRNTHKGFYLALIALAWLLALGPELRLIGGQGPVFAPLPYALLYHLPGFSAMRVPARLSLLVMLGIAVLAGWGAADLNERAEWGAGLTLTAIALMAVSYCPAPLHPRPIAVGAEVPPVYRWLAAQAPGVIVELPSASSIWFLKDGISPQRLAHQQYFSTYHWQPMIMGYSGMYPTLLREHIDHLLHFPSCEALAYLQGLDVRYVIIHWDELSEKGRHTLERGLRRFEGKLISEGRFGSDEVYRLSPVEEGPPSLRLHCPSTMPTSGPYYAYLLVQTGEERAVVNPYLTHFQFRFKWQDKDHEAWSVEREADRKLRSTRHGTLPLTIGPGTTVIPLALPRPSGTEAQLTIEARVPGQSHAIRNTQHVSRAIHHEVDIPGLGGKLWQVEQPYEQGLTLSHVILPRGQEYTAGDTVNVTLAWRNEIEGREHVPTASVQIFDPAGNRVAQRDMVLANGLYRQEDWHTGQVVLDRHLLSLPPWLPPGDYDLLVSLYESEEMHLLGPRTSGGTIRVRRPPLDLSLIEHQRWARLGEKIALLGYRLSETEVQPGGRVTLTLFWKPLGPIHANYTVFTHLLGSRKMIAQADGQPCGGAYPTSRWREGQVVEDRYEWLIPDDTPPGEYPIEVGMYLLDTMERLPVFDEAGKRLAGDRVLLGSVRVK